MNDIKTNIARNIQELRKAKGMTQLELAERLNYSDKAVSKWERGESLPDVIILAELAELFGVTLDYLVACDRDSLPEFSKSTRSEKQHKYNRGLIIGISIQSVWLVALVVFVIISLTVENDGFKWLFFAYSVPISMIIWLVFNSIWFNRRRNYLIISALVWSLIACIHLTLLGAHINVWPIYFLGIPAEVIIIMCSKLRIKPKSDKTEK